MTVGNPAPRPRRVTMTDVARAAGISRGTVSRFFTGTSYVSKAAREAIELAIREVGYVPNAAARSLAGSPSRNIALIVREGASEFADDQNLIEMMVGANRRLLEDQLQLLVLLAGDRNATDRVRDTLAGGLIDGVLLASARIDDPLVDLVRASGVPAAVLGRQSDPTGLAMVDVDNTGGAREITARLLGQGRRRPAMLAGPENMRATLDRLQGFREATGDLFDPGLVRHTHDWTFASGQRAMTELIHANPEIDAVFGACDAIAVGAIAALTEAGRDVPGDVGVVGFDNTRWAEHSEPTLSTVAQPSEALGARMAELVIRQLAGEDLGGTVTFEPTELRWRGSA